MSVPGGRPLRRVLAAYAICVYVEFATWLAIVLVAYRNGGPALAGVASFAMLLPAVVLVPLIVVRLDRLPRGTALAAAHSGVAATSLIAGLLLAGSAPFWAVLIAGAALTTAISLVRPMHYAAIPRLAGTPGDMVAANAWSSAFDGVAIFVGFLTAGVVTQVLGASTVLLAGAALGAVSAALCTRLGIVEVPDQAVLPEDSPGQIRSALAGLRVLGGSAGVLALLALLSVTSVLDGSNEVVVITFNDRVLGLGESSAGLLAGAFGVGLAIGGLVLSGVARRPRLAPLIVAGAVVLGVTEASVAGLTTLAPAALLLALTGAGSAMIMVCARTLLQRSVDDAVLARVFAVQEGVYLIGLTLGAVVGPALIAGLGPRWAFVVLGGLITVMGLLAARGLRALDLRAVLHPREVALLSRVPFLALLPPYELERLAQGSQWVTVAPETDVVRQGEPGDAYYLVADGSLSVTVDGIPKSHTLDPGDGFGEIALLYRVARTATVTALRESELLKVDSERFLAAVTASPDGSSLAREIAEARRASDLR